MHQSPRANAYLADPTFFSFFSYNFIEGNGGQALKNPNAIVLSEEIARKLFGNQPALNKVVHVESNTNGNGDYTVTGVFRPGSTPSHIDGRFFMSFAGGALSQYVKSQTGMANNNMFFTYLKLKPGTDARKLEAKLPAFVEKYMRKDLRLASFDKRQFLTAVPGRLHFAAHSHHPWPDVTRAAQMQAWDNAARLMDGKWGPILQHKWPELQKAIARLLKLPDPTTLAFAPNTHEFVLRILGSLPGPMPR